ncbi:MAG: hypothetical protein WCD69_26250, partial [Xanthobacteraceae bacterium]
MAFAYCAGFLQALMNSLEGLHVDLKGLARSLYARRHEAVVVPYEPQTTTSPASEHWCHKNVDRWVLEHPDHMPVRGWLVFDYSENELGRQLVSRQIGVPIPHCRFNAHSVVETPDGRLFDLTPAPKASQRYPFLRHDEADGDFEALLLAQIV